MIDAIHKTLGKIASEPRSLRTFVAQYAHDTHDLGFFFDLDRFPKAREILCFFADSERCRRFFDSRYENITAVLTDMQAAWEFPDFIPDGDLRCWLAESAFLYTARQIAREIGIDDEA